MDEAVNGTLGAAPGLSTLDLLVLNESAKSITTKVKDLDPERDIFTTAHGSVGGFDLGAHRSSIAQYSSLRRRFDRELKGILADFQAGKIDHRQALLKFRNTATTTYRSAFRLGAMRAGNPYYKDIGLTAVDAKFAVAARRAEERFFNRFLTQTARGTSRLDPMTRVSNYAKSLDAQFWNGYVAGSPETVQIHWELGLPSGDHCGDCEEIAAHSPYNRNTLPTVPRAGDTQCLHQCYCQLVTYVPGTGQVGRRISRTGLEKSTVIVRTVDGLEVDQAIANLFDDLYDQLYVLRAKIALTRGAEQAKFIAQRRVLNAEIIKLAKAYNVRVVPRFSVEDVIKIAESLKSKGYDIVKGVWLCPS